MSKADIKAELHQIIDNINDSRILEATYTLLSRQLDVVAFSVEGKPLGGKEFEMMIDEGEADIKAGRVHSHEEVKAYFEKKIASDG